MSFLFVLLCCRRAGVLPLAFVCLLLARKLIGLSGPGPGLNDSEAYALLQAFFSPRLALPSLLLAVVLLRSSKGRGWLPFVALIGFSNPQLDSLSTFAGPSTGLLNGLVLIHPPLLFLGYACLAALLLDLPSPRVRVLLGKRATLWPTKPWPSSC